MNTLLIIGVLIHGSYLSTIRVETNVTTEREGYTNINYWDEGTMIYAHNYLSGALFPEAETITVVYEDGSTADFELDNSYELYHLSAWTNTIERMSSDDTLTFVTCLEDGRLLKQFRRAEEDPR